MKRSHHRGRLRCERLESRLPLAGNVLVSLDGRDLTITGDNLENAIDVTLGLDASSNPAWIIEGVNDASGVDTTVNGQAQFAATIPNNGFRDVTIRLRQARVTSPTPGTAIDHVNLNDLSIRGSLEISGAFGGDVGLTNLDVRQHTSITFGQGWVTAPGGGAIAASTIVLADSEFGTQAGGQPNLDLSITTGNSDDEVSFDNVETGGKVLVTVNGGSNSVEIVESTLRKHVEISAGAGADEVLVNDSTLTSSLTITTRGGAGTVHLVDSSIRGPVVVTGGAANDEFIMTDTTIHGSLVIDAKGGDNTAAAFGTRTGLTSTTSIGRHLIVLGGNGIDAMGLVGVVIGESLNAHLANGNNFAGAADIVVRGATAITTGNGNDIVAIGLHDSIGTPLPPGALGNVLLGNVFLSTGAGNDIASASDVEYGKFNPNNNLRTGGRVTVKLGAGSDQLLAENVSFVGIPNPFKAIELSSGGPGFDTVFSALNPTPSQLAALEFEASNTGNQQVAIDAIFAALDLHFSQILADFGIII